MASCEAIARLSSRCLRSPSRADLETKAAAARNLRNIEAAHPDAAEARGARDETVVGVVVIVCLVVIALALLLGWI